MLRRAQSDIQSVFKVLVDVQAAELVKLIHVQLVKDSVIKHSFGYRFENINKNQNPGPGSYIHDQ